MVSGRHQPNCVESGEARRVLEAGDSRYDLVTVGSSAGGYAAILYESLLHAKKSYAFASQFSLEHQLSEGGLDPFRWTV
jgi:hypothetical protein